MLKAISHNFSELLSESTAYGLPRIFRSKRFLLKIYWLLFFLMGSLASIMFVLSSLKNYYDFEVITKIESVYEQPMPFPTVSFCPYGPDEDIIKSIYWCGFNLNGSCYSDGTENHLELFQTFLGKCYRFNSGINMKNKSIPTMNSTIGGRDDSFILNLKKTKGLYVWVHDNLSRPLFDNYNDHNGDRIHVMSKCMNQIKIQKIVEKKLGLPYNQCYEDVNTFPANKTIIEYINKTNTKYKQTNCLELCFDIFYLADNPCNCTNTKLGSVWYDCWSHLNLTGDDRWNCIYNYKLNFFKETLLDKCKEYCPLECESVSYSIVQDSILDEGAKFQLRVYFESLKYTSISQIPKTKGFDLVAEIGGILGLFIGLSFVSFFEIAELFIEVLFIFFQKKTKISTLFQVCKKSSTLHFIIFHLIRKIISYILLVEKYAAEWIGF